MPYETMKKIYFSPTGGTKKIVDLLAKEWKPGSPDHDLLRSPLVEPLELSAQDLVVVGMPVYAGRIPSLCRDMLSNLKGNGTPAIAIAVYGNRDYEDALLELADLLTENGFSVIAAGAFIAAHSIFPRVGAGRPDDADKAVISAFSGDCKKLLASWTPGQAPQVRIQGNPDYRAPASVPLKPSGDSLCTQCGACVQICPTHSIPADNPRETIKETCISCAACIAACPAGSRKFHGLPYKLAQKAFEKKCSAYRIPEVFLANPAASGSL